MPAGDVGATTGTVVASSGGFALNIAGALAPAFFPAGYIPAPGDVVTVMRLDGLLYVWGPVSTTPRPLTGTVAGAASSGRVPVTVDVGPSPLSCRFVGDAPSIGTLVRLDWQSTSPWIWPTAAAPLPPPDPVEPPDDPVVPPPPPPPPETGSDTFPVVDAGSYRPGYGRWDNGAVLQWRYGSESENRGAWFLGVAPTQLRGRTVTRFRFATGPRARVGSYNATLTARFYLLSNPTRPGGDASRIAGPYDVSIAANSSPTVDLPTAWGQHLADNGGGIGISGSPYLGFTPSGSAATLDWRR